MLKRRAIEDIQKFKLERWRVDGVDIPALSKINHLKLNEDLLTRKGVPEAEKDCYGSEELTEDEQNFFEYWQKDIVRRFMGLHGSEELELIKKAGGLVPVADRKREFKNYQYSNTQILEVGLVKRYCILF